MRFENKYLAEIESYKVSSPKAWNYVKDEEVLKLDWNESTIEPSPKVYEAVKRTFTENRWNWYPNIDNSELIKSISMYSKVPTINVQVFASSDALHEYIVRCFISQEDKILYVSPTYDNFRAVAEANGGILYPYDMDENFKLDYDRFQRDIDLNTPKIIYLVNPNNPTGTLHGLENLDVLIKANPNILFIVDEAYFEFTDVTISYLTVSCDNLVVSRTFSKAFGMASFRVGYCIAHSSIINSLNKIRNPKNVSLFAQEAALAALEDLEYMRSYVREVNIVKKNVFTMLSNMDWIKPVWGEGNFLFMNVDSRHKNSFIDFLELNKIFIRDYSHMRNSKNYIRITIGLQGQMNRLIGLIKSYQNTI